MNNNCPHCGLQAVVREGKGLYCFLCARRFGVTGRRYVSELREIARGCFSYAGNNNQGDNTGGDTNSDRLYRSNRLELYHRR